jgi:methionine biosynthesis protein MetW
MTVQDTFRPTARLPKIDGARGDHLVVASMIEPGSKVLDVGCGEGDLLRLLETRGVDGRGIELSREGVNSCVSKGLAVIQGDADTDLADYPDDSFDYVILSQTLQATRQPRTVHRKSTGDMVRHAEHSLLHHQGFRSALRRN